MKCSQNVNFKFDQIFSSNYNNCFNTDIFFFIKTGALTDMPAVRVFSLYAALAVLFDFLLQITVFIALMTLDAKRQKVRVISH